MFDIHSRKPENLRAEPTRAGDRLEVVDALRGFALLGVLVVNLRDLTLYEPLTESARRGLPTAGLDRYIEWVMAAFVDAKAMTIFTVLFGVSFALQMQRGAVPAGRTALYLRRLLVLLAIGLVHAFFWWGDILILYALAGLLLIPLRGLGARPIAIMGVMIALFSSPLLRPLIGDLLPKIIPAAEASARAMAAFRGDNWGALVTANAHHFEWMRSSAWGLPFFTFGRILVGVGLGYAGVLRDPALHRRFWLRTAAVLLPLGFALTVFVLLRDHGVIGAGPGWWKTDMARNLVRIARSGASLSLGVGYVASFVLLFQNARYRRWLMVFAPVGRVALTNYLTQTALGMALFYGVGLGIGPRFGLVGVLIAGTVIFALQLFLSRWWLARYRFGPVEWLWRCLTYWHRVPMRRSVAA